MLGPLVLWVGTIPDFMHSESAEAVSVGASLPLSGDTVHLLIRASDQSLFTYVDEPPSVPGRVACFKDGCT